MATSIPSAAGVPGISGPPNWLGGPGVDLRLDDVRWRGAIKRAFGSGASGGDFFRATQALEGADQFIYLTFRAGFAQQLDTALDYVWLGLMKSSGATAMVIKIQVHPAGFDQKGPPSANPLGTLANIQVFTPPAVAGDPWSEVAEPTWIDTNAKYWLRSPSGVMDPDQASRWAVQIKIKAKNVGTLLDNDGPNIGTSFQMWYIMRGSVGGNPTILGEYRVDGLNISPLSLNSDFFPLPAGIWDLFNLTSGAATSGGLALYWGDVLVSNAAYGEGWTIDNGQDNTFICRPRNYSSANVPAQNLNATFRIANWGSVGGDPNQVNFNDSEWSYVPGNSENVPVQASLDVGPIPAGNPPPPGVNPIALPVTPMTLPAGKSKHQCVLCTMSGTNVNFLNDAIYQNMNYDSASLLAREAEISIATLEPFSSAPRDIYLALEKVNLVKNTPPGTDEGRFLEASFRRVIEKEGELAGKLIKAQSILSEVGDGPSFERLEGLLNTLNRALEEITDKGGEQRDQMLAAMRPWLLEITKNDSAAKRLAKVLIRLADLMEGSAQETESLLNALRKELIAWGNGVGNDPSTMQNGPTVFLALKAYNDAAFGNDILSRALENLAHWLQAGPSPTALPPIVDELIGALARMFDGNPKLKAAVGSFARDVAKWLGGSTRLEILVNVLTEVGLTEEEMDEVFPTFRIHVYHDTGFRQTVSDGTSRPVLKPQSSFGLYVYHEGSLQGWETAIQGAERIEDNLYLISVPNKGTTKIKVVVQAVEEGDERLPEEPIRPREYPKADYTELDKRKGCLYALWKLLGLK